jgi:hypothetical protein
MRTWALAELANKTMLARREKRTHFFIVSTIILEQGAVNSFTYWFFF